MGKFFLESVETKIRLWLSRTEQKSEKPAVSDTPPLNSRVGCSIVHEGKEGER